MATYTLREPVVFVSGAILDELARAMPVWDEICSPAKNPLPMTLMFRQISVLGEVREALQHLRATADLEEQICGVRFQNMTTLDHEVRRLTGLNPNLRHEALRYLAMLGEINVLDDGVVALRGR